MTQELDLDYSFHSCHLIQMKTLKLQFIAKAQHLCLLLLLCVCRALAVVPGPCRHSVTQDHLQSLNQLIDNQLDHGCFINYPFTERLHLSKICYIKAALPLTLELLSKHFHYVRNSDNRRYVSNLEKVVFHLYSQRCIPAINEEVEDSPVRFTRMMETSPKEALKKVRSLFQMYMKLMTVNNGYVKWNCQEEYSVEEELNSPPATGTTVAESMNISEKKDYFPV